MAQPSNNTAWNSLSVYLLLRHTDSQMSHLSKESLAICVQELEPHLGGSSEWRTTAVKQKLRQFRRAITAADRPPSMWPNPLTGALADGSIVALPRLSGVTGADYSRFSIYKERPTSTSAADDASALGDRFLSTDAALLATRASFAVFRGAAVGMPIDEFIGWGSRFVRAGQPADGVEEKGHRYGDILQECPCNPETGTIRYAHACTAASANGSDRYWAPFKDKARQAASAFAAWRAGWVSELSSRGPTAYTGALTYVPPVSRLFLREFKPGGPAAKGVKMHLDASSLSVIIMLRPAEARGDLLVSLSNSTRSNCVEKAPVLALNLDVGDIVVLDSQCLHQVDDVEGRVSRWTMVAFFGYS